MKPIKFDFGTSSWIVIKVDCVFPMVISLEFRMERYRDGNYQEDAPHFIRAYLFNFILIIQFDDTGIFSWTSTLVRCYTFTIPSALIFSAHWFSTFISLPASFTLITNTMTITFITTLITTFSTWF